MGISDRIEAFINELMKDEAEFAEFGRNELADIFNCVPSQINYVISTRFSPERGYIVESRRGGGGYVKIRKISLGDSDDVISQIGERCDFQRAKSAILYLNQIGDLSSDAANVILSAVSERALAKAGENKDRVRADILKNAIASLK